MSTAKSIIDEIDGLLARHYEFAGEGFDLIINCDIKYSAGGEAVGDAE